MTLPVETLRRQRDLLAKGAVNWTDADLDAIAEFSSVSHSELSLMRHKMANAAEFSIANLEALEAMVAASPRASTLRPQIEQGGSLASAIEAARSFTGVFGPVKAELESLDAELAKATPRSRFRRANG